MQHRSNRHTAPSELCQVVPERCGTMGPQRCPSAWPGLALGRHWRYMELPKPGQSTLQSPERCRKPYPTRRSERERLFWSYAGGRVARKPVPPQSRAGCSISCCLIFKVRDTVRGETELCAVNCALSCARPEFYLNSPQCTQCSERSTAFKVSGARATWGLPAPAPYRLPPATARQLLHLIFPLCPCQPRLPV